MHNNPWRLLDTGRKTSAENMALDHVLIEARKRAVIPNTLRFLQFMPSAVLVGFHQRVEEEVRLAFCQQRGIEINRRLTGGGAIYFDESQLGWEVVFDCEASRPDELSQRLIYGAIEGLKHLGVEASYRPRNDIVVKGRKIGGTGGVIDKGVAFFQGTLLIDFDVEIMMKALRLPIEKLSRKELAMARKRVIDLKEILGFAPQMEPIKEAMRKGFEKSLGASFQKGSLCPWEEEALVRCLPTFKGPSWVFKVKGASSQSSYKALYKARSGLIKVDLKVDIKRRLLKEVFIRGDFFLSPREALLNLEAQLRGCRMEEASEKLQAFFLQEKKWPFDLRQEEITEALTLAMKKADYKALNLNASEANRLFPVRGSLEDILRDASVLLLPYCAKEPECPWRNHEDCPKCGQCLVGDAFSMAEQRGYRPITVCNYSHLKRLLKDLKRQGVKSYLGFCCEAFFVRHQRDLEAQGLPGLLIETSQATCYDLNQGSEAYSGHFKGQTSLRLDLLEKLLSYNGGSAPQTPAGGSMLPPDPHIQETGNR